MPQIQIDNQPVTQITVIEPESGKQGKREPIHTVIMS